MINMEKNKQLIINLITTVFVLLINTVINFGLSGYIVEKIGEEAYGFISLATNFVSYATIFTTALNSMCSRFITIDIHQNNKDSANKYFSSVLIANALIILFLIIPSVFIIMYLEKIINVPIDLIKDIKLLFAFIFFNFFISLLGGVFTIATYCKNKLYLSSLRQMESYIVKLIVIVLLFILFKPAVFYVGVATLLATIYIFIFNIYYTKKLLPDIKINTKYFSWQKIKILLSSGLWNSIINLGNLLMDGLDLIISNLALNSTAMGIVALAKLPSSIFNSLIASTTTVFQPPLLEYYSQNDIDMVVKETKKDMKISGLFGNIPFAYILLFGLCFCTVWMPNTDTKLLSGLCIIAFINIYVGGITNPLYNIFTITNNVKPMAILNIICGVVSTITVLIVLKITNLGVYAIVGVSTIVAIIKGFLIVPIYCSKCLNKKWKTFFGPIMKYILTTLFMIIAFYLIRIIIMPKSWLMIFVSIIACGIIGLTINYFVLFHKDDRKAIIGFITNKFRFLNIKSINKNR